MPGSFRKSIYEKEAFLMKKRFLSLLFACFTAAACSISAYAETTAADPLDIMANGIQWCNSVFDDGGLFASFAAQHGTDRYFVSIGASLSGTIQDYDSSVTAEESGRLLTFCLNIPRKDTGLFFPVTADMNDAALAVFDEYFPNSNRNTALNNAEWDAAISKQIYSLQDDTYFRFTVHRTDENAEAVNEKVDALCKALTDAGLISAFYAPGTVCVQHELYTEYLTGYSVEKTATSEAPAFDPEQVQRWLDEKEIPCTIRKTEKKYETLYDVIPDEKLSFQAHFDLALQLYNYLGILPRIYDDSFKSSLSKMGYCPELPAVTIRADAALLAGDADCKNGVDVSDAVLTARFAAEDSEAKISALGKQNADVNGDGSITSADVVLILKIIAKMI